MMTILTPEEAHAWRRAQIKASRTALAELLVALPKDAPMALENKLHVLNTWLVEQESALDAQLPLNFDS